MAGWICSAEMSPLICMQIPLFFLKCSLFVESYGTVVKGRVQKSIDQLMSEYSQSDSSTYLSKYVISMYLLLILLSIHLYVWLSNSLCTHSSIYKNLSISIHPSLNFKSFEFYLFKFEFWIKAILNVAHPRYSGNNLTLATASLSRPVWSNSILHCQIQGKFSTIKWNLVKYYTKVWLYVHYVTISIL